MRFSLGTFVLMILFISSAYAVVMMNEAWYLAETRPEPDEMAPMKYWNEVSPDRTKYLGSMQHILHPNDVIPVMECNFRYDSVGIFEYKPVFGKLLYPVTATSAMHVNFKSDTEIWLLDVKNVDAAPDVRRKSEVRVYKLPSWPVPSWPDVRRKSEVRVYKRRYEQTAWGYVTRTEVLIMLVTMGLLIYRLIANTRIKKRTA